MVWLPDGKKIQTYERFDMIHDREKNRRFHVPQPTFLFHMETPLRLSRNMLHGWKDNSMLAEALAACTYLSSKVSQLYDAMPKNRYFYHILVSSGDALMPSR